MQKRKIYSWALILLVISWSMISCGVDYEPYELFDVVAQFQKDQEVIANYLADNEIDAYDIDSSGVYISIFHQGTEDTLIHPTQDTMTVGYKGYLVNGLVFDQTSEEQVYIAELRNMIYGWRIAIPEMTKGDSATIFVPSYWGYGNEAVGNIPPSSVLIFDVYLDSFVKK